MSNFRIRHCRESAVRFCRVGRYSPASRHKATMARVSFQGIENHPDYVFYLLRPGGGGGPRTFPPTLTAVKDSKPFNLNGGRYGHGGMKLLAVEQKEFDKRAKDDPALKWLTGKTEGYLSAPSMPPSWLPRQRQGRSNDDIQCLAQGRQANRRDSTGSEASDDTDGSRANGGSRSRHRHMHGGDGPLVDAAEPQCS